jgi:predicted GNAT superfamily acetyltransferase
VQEEFGFSELEVLPAAHLHFVAESGGLNLGAFMGMELVGYLHAFLGIDERRTVFCITNVCVLSRVRGGGVGALLMGAARAEAAARGIPLLKWTTSALSASNLYLYLSKCGARLVDYHAGFYKGLLSDPDGLDEDQVEIHWAAGDVDPRAGAGGPLGKTGQESGPFDLLTRTTLLPDGTRVFDGLVTGMHSRRYGVELPYDAAATARLDRWQIGAWRRGLGRAIAPLLARGYEGTRVERDLRDRRAYLLLEKTPAGE